MEGSDALLWHAGVCAGVCGSASVAAAESSQDQGGVCSLYLPSSMKGVTFP